MSQSADLSELKTVLRGLLISTKRAMTLNDLSRDFKNQEGYDIPFRKFGFNSLLDFLYSISDTVQVQSSFGSRSPVIAPVLSEKSSHVEALVQKQRVNPPRRGQRGNYTLRRNAVHSTITKQNILIPYQIQQRLKAMVSQHPEGIELSKVVQILRPEILYNYGIEYSVSDLIEDLGHIVKIINDRVYTSEEVLKKQNYPIFHRNIRANTEFKPNLQQMTTNFHTREEDKFSPAKSAFLNNCGIKPADYEDEKKMNNSVENADLNVDKLCDEKNSHFSERENNASSTPENLTCNGTVCDFPRSEFGPECDSLLISNKMKNNLKSLLHKYPDGVLCSELPQLYKNEFKVELDYRELGFISVVQLVCNIPTIFHCVRENGEDWKVLDASKPLPSKYKSSDMKTTTRVHKNTEPHIPSNIKNNIKQLMLLHCNGLWSESFLDKYQEVFGQFINFRELNFDSLESFLLFLNDEILHLRYVKERIMIYSNVDKLQEQEADIPLPHLTEKLNLSHELYPAEVVGPKNTIPQQKLPPDICKDSYLEVIVAEIYTPHHFWIQLRGEQTHKALDKLMNEIQAFYDQEIDYRMPEATISVDQYCMAPYNEELHRARIIAVPNLTEAQVFFVDYGTKGKVKKSDLRFMHQDFAELPIQAIKASLANIIPANGATKWPSSVSKRFLELVSDKDLIAIVSDADHNNRELEIALVDTNGDEDIHINDTLKYEGLAEYKRTVPPAAVQPAPTQRIEVENECPMTHRPPPGFTSVPTQLPAVSSLFNTATAYTNTFSDINQSWLALPAYFNTMASNMHLMQWQHMLLNPALMYSAATLANPLGFPMVNPTIMLNPQMMNETTTNASDMKSPCGTLVSEETQTVASSVSSPSTNEDSVHLNISRMTLVDIPGVSEETMSMNLPPSDTEHVTVSENIDDELESEDSELFRSDDEEDADLTRNMFETTKSIRHCYVKRTEVAGRPLHVINMNSVAFLCTDEVIHIFTDFSGRHVVLKILEANQIFLPFREISRRESPEIIEALEVYDVSGVQRSSAGGNIMGKVHLTPLLLVPQLLTVLNVKSRDVFRGLQEEIDRFTSDDSYWILTGT